MSRVIALMVACLFIFNSLCLDEAKALAPAPGTQNPLVRREAEILSMLLRGRIIYARTDEDKEFLRLNNADALLLSHGKILVSESFEKNDLGLIRKIIHEEIEAIMQIMEEEDGYTYSSIVNMILNRKVPFSRRDHSGYPRPVSTVIPAKAEIQGRGELQRGSISIGNPDTKLRTIREIYLELFPNTSVHNRSNKFLANHIIATAFELLIPVRNGLLTSDNIELSKNEQLFLEAITPVIDSNRHNYFTGMFWDRGIREEKIRIAMANGQTFYRVASEETEQAQRDVIHPIKRSPERIKQDRDTLKDFLRVRRYTVQGLSDATGIPLETVWEDVRNDPEIMNHLHLDISDRNRSALKSQYELMVRICELMDNGCPSLADLSRITGFPKNRISETLSLPELGDYRNLIMAQSGRRSSRSTKIPPPTLSEESSRPRKRKERDPAKRQADRAKLRELLEGASYTHAELANLIGIPFQTVKDDIKVVFGPGGHPKLVKAAEKRASEESADIMALDEALEQGPHTVLQLSRNTGIHISTARKRVKRTDNLKRHRNLISRVNRQGQSLILYADDLLENAVFTDIEETLKGISSTDNLLSRGRIIIFARKEENAAKLKEVIGRSGINMAAIIMTPEEGPQAVGSEITEVRSLIRRAKAKGAADILAIIKGPARNVDPEKFVGFANSMRIPVVVIGREEGIYSFAQALLAAVEIKDKDGAGGWYVMLPPMRSLASDVKKRQEEYDRSLQALLAA